MTMAKPSVIGKVKLLPGESVSQLLAAASEFNATPFKTMDNPFAVVPTVFDGIFVHLEWKNGHDCLEWRQYRRHMRKKATV